MGRPSFVHRARERAAIGERWQRVFGLGFGPGLDLELQPAAAPTSALEGLFVGGEVLAAAEVGAPGGPRLTPVAVAAVAVVVALGLGWAGWLALGSQPDSAADGRVPVQVAGSVAATGSSGPAAAGPSALSSAAAALIVVHVAGQVRRPGLVHLPAGARVADALAAAGGPLRGVDLTTINLARVVLDGEQILVGLGGGAGTGGASGGGGGSGAGAGSGAATGGLVDLNAATLEQLEALPGVGPVLAQRILDFRLAHTRFTSVDELREVSGIGERKFADIAPKVRIG